MPCANIDCPFNQPPPATGAPGWPESHCLIDGATQKVRLAKGEVLFLQGQASTSLYSLMSGVVKITSHEADGREQIVGLSNRGNLLVGLQSLSDTHYAYSACAASAVTVCRINQRVLLARLEERGDLAVRFINAVNAQLAHSRALLKVMGHSCAAAKIASFILLVIGESRAANGRFSMPFSRLEIANLLGLSEETVCRMMAGMKRAGVIHAPRGNIEIRNLDQLRSIASGVGGRRILA
jgi:CRP/FNR family transcriptional regulator